MPQSFDEVFAAAARMADNVLPTTRVRSTPGSASSEIPLTGAFYSPAAVAPLQDSGGFNSVVELSASICCRQAESALHPAPLDRTLTAAIRRTLRQNTPAGGVFLEVAGGLELESAPGPSGVRLTLTLQSLTFPDADTVALSFRVALAFTSVTETLDASGGPVVLTNAQAIGSFRAELRAPLVHRDEPSRCRTRAFADLRRGRWTEVAPAAAADPAASFLRLVYETCFSGWLNGATGLLRAPLDLPLTPTVSLVGQNPGTASVPEVTDFAVRVFAIQGSPDFEPALALAFDVMPGCHGIAEDVRHFIGPNPYGVISDEFVVACLFRHKWNLGGFDRRLAVQTPTRVSVNRNGHQQLEDAIVFGYFNLLSLDHVSITTDSNARSDCIRFGGQASAVATRVQLVADGQSVSAGDVDLGPPESTPWGVRAELTLQNVLNPNPEIQDFQRKASRDGARHIVMPFAFLPDSGSQIQVNYIRVEGVSKHVFALGSLSSILH